MDIGQIEMSVVNRGTPWNSNVFLINDYKEVILAWVTPGGGSSSAHIYNVRYELHVIAGDIRRRFIKSITGETGSSKWRWSVNRINLHCWKTWKFMDSLRVSYPLNQRSLRISAKPEPGDWHTEAFMEINPRKSMGMTYAHPPINHTEINKLARAAVNKTMPAGVLIDYLREHSPTIEEWIANPNLD